MTVIIIFVKSKMLIFSPQKQWKFQFSSPFTLQFVFVLRVMHKKSTVNSVYSKNGKKSSRSKSKSQPYFDIFFLTFGALLVGKESKNVPFCHFWSFFWRKHWNFEKIALFFGFHSNLCIESLEDIKQIETAGGKFDEQFFNLKFLRKKSL